MFNIEKKLLKTKQKKNATSTPPNRINILKKLKIEKIAYTLDAWSRDLNSNFTLKHCLFGGVKLAKNADPDMYIVVMVLDSTCVEFSLPDGSMGKNVIFLKLI